MAVSNLDEPQPLINKKETIIGVLVPFMVSSPASEYAPSGKPHLLTKKWQSGGAMDMCSPQILDADQVAFAGI